MPRREYAYTTDTSATATQATVYQHQTVADIVKPSATSATRKRS